VDGVELTLIDNGMPVAVLDAASVGVSGHETPAQLEADEGLRARVEALRLVAGRLMGLGDVSSATVPKMCLVSAPEHGGSLATRFFIPHRVHAAIGVLAAVTVGTAAALPGSVAARHMRAVAEVTRLEHPTGWFDVVVDLAAGRSSVVSTARLLLDGVVHPRGAR
jgi:4-oxalomesaconate tautomerase